MSLKKGFLRLTIALSILAGIGVPLYIGATGNIEEPLLEIPLAFAIGFVSVWLVYLFIKYVVVGYIIKGFKKE